MGRVIRSLQESGMTHSVSPKTRPGTLVTIDPAMPGGDIPYWSEEGLIEDRGITGRTNDKGPYILLKMSEPPLGCVFRRTACVSRSGRVIIFSHFDLQLYDYHPGVV